MLKINPDRVWGIVIRHIYLWRRSVARLTDTFYWPVISLFIWGYVSIYIVKNAHIPNLIVVFVGGLIFWTVIQRSQQEMSTGLLEDGWSRNLINVFASPLTSWEFLLGLIVTSFIKMLTALIIMGITGYLLFHFNILSFGIFLPFFVLNLLFASWWMGLLTNGLIVRFGYDMEALAWTLVFIIQPFIGVFYPISTLPKWMQPIAYVIPPTYTFEGLRKLVFNGYFDWRLFFLNLALNIVFIFVTLVFYKRMFDTARDKGYLTKLF